VAPRDKKKKVVKKVVKKNVRSVPLDSPVHAQLARREAELKILERMSKSFWSTLDYTTISQHLFQMLHEYTPFDALLLMLRGPNGHQLIVTSQKKITQSSVGILCKDAIQQFGRSTSTKLSKNDIFCIPNIIKTSDISGNLTVKHTHFLPLNVLDKTHGIIGFVSSDRKVQFDENTFINIVANELALVVDYQHIQEKLLRERNMLSSILHSMTSAVVVVDELQNVILLNPMAEVILGVSANNVIGKKIQHVVSDKEVCKLFGVVSNQASEYLSREMEIANTTQGRSMEVKANLAKVRNPGGRVAGVVMVLNDVTHEHDVERARTEFVSVTSHELRTPMAAIREAVSLIIDGVTGPINDKQRKFLDMARRNIDRLTAIINDLLDLSKIESGKLQLTREMVSPNTIAEGVFITFESAAQEKEISLLKNFAERLPKIQVDQDKVAQILTNLVSNAIKFTPKEGMITIGTCLSKKNNKFIEFYVKDTGIGIDHKDFGKLFQKFAQIDSSLSKVAGGTGLGLAISKELAEMHGGHIWVESEPGKGSSFHLLLPVRALEVADRHRYVLLVTGNVETSDLLSSALRKGRFDVGCVARGVQVLDKIHERRPDLIIVDSKLPDMDGLALCKNLKSDSTTALLPIVFLTEAGQENKIWGALSLGVNGYLVGPMDRNAILTAVKEAIP